MKIKLAWDWHEHPGNIIKSLKRALPKLGVKIIDDPEFRGTDDFGIILSND